MENPSSEWDWEVIPSSAETLFSSVDAHGGGVIRSDHFSLESEQNYTAVSSTTNSDEEEDGDSDNPNPNPSWVDPNDISVVGGGNPRKRSRSPASYYSSDSDNDSGGRNLLNLIQPHSGCCSGGLGGGFSDNFPKSEEDNREVNVSEEKRVVWWKVPIEVLKYCVWRVSPVWSISMAAAALMGFVILRRRYLQKIKRKSLSIQFNVTLDHKKVSQFMSRAARLNEAFSVVKWVPIIRPALPAPGMTSWPVMSLR